MEAVAAHLRPAERDRRRQARSPPERRIALCRFHVVQGGPDPDQGAQPRPREPCRGYPPQQVPVPDDRSRHHARREREVGKALVGAFPQRQEDREGSREMKIRHELLVAGLVAGMVALPAAAQVKPNATAADVAGYAGADRHQKLVEGAKKEGELNIYTSAQTDDMGALTKAS